MTQTKRPLYLSILYPSMLEEWKDGEHQKVLERTEEHGYVAAMFAAYLINKQEIDVLEEFLTALRKSDGYDS
jgi:hypothetical protein